MSIRNRFLRDKKIVSGVVLLELTARGVSTRVKKVVEIDGNRNVAVKIVDFSLPKF